MSPRSHSGPHRVLFVETNEDGTTGGSHRSMYELVRRLDPDRFQPVVLYYQDNLFADKLREEGVRVVVFAHERARELAARTSGNLVRKLGDILAAVPRRARLVRGEGIDLVHINNSPYVAFDDWLPACRLTRTPIVASVRGDDTVEGRLAKTLFRQFDRVMAVSRWIGDVMRAEGVPEDKIRIVYNGVDVGRIREQAVRGDRDVRAELGIPSNAVWAVMVGNLREWKGQHVVLEALRSARARGADVRLAIVGEPSSLEEDHEYEAGLRAFVRESALEDYVSFLGKRADVPELFAAADVAVHASTDPEPFGLVLVEALATGTPVIASSYGGPAEVLSEASGFLHDPKNPEELASILLRVAASSRDVLDEMGRSASARADEFDIAKTVAEMERVYEEILNGG